MGQWKANLSDLGGIRIPRCNFSQEGLAHMELHQFADTSEIGYGTVSYLRKIDEDGQIECSFIMAKSRTAPSPFVTVSRLELQAAVVAATIDGHIKRERDWPTYCKGYLLDRFQNNPAIHTERDKTTQDVCGKQGYGEQGFLKARTVETRPRKGQSC